MGLESKSEGSRFDQQDRKKEKLLHEILFLMGIIVFILILHAKMTEKKHNFSEKKLK